MSDLATNDLLYNSNMVNTYSWAEIAINTANKRAYLQGEGTKRAEWGIHTVLISQYGACSPICQPLQGKVYIDDVWSGGTSAEAESTGYGLLSVAIASGLFHPNCKHTMSTYFVGLTKEPSKVDILETNENSNIIATQRYNERQVRKYIRLENGSLDASNKAKYRTKVKEWQLRNDKLVKAHPELHRNYDREQLRGTNKSKSASDESRDMFDNDGLKILKFANKKSEVSLKPVIRNTDEEVDRYFKLMKLRTDNEKIATTIKNDMKLMPKRDLDLLKDFKLTINEKTEGPNNYRRHTAFSYIIDSSINLKENVRPGTFAHEFAHFASDRIKLYHHKEFLEVLENAVIGSKLDSLDINGNEYVTVSSKKFIKPYQGRTYIKACDFNVNVDNMDISELQEYISVGYQTFIIAPDSLYQKDKMLYDYLEREGLVYAKRKN
ncbi:MAG: phage minor capsid protein [Niameybacter sp.]|uniref:phage minor capsid protein n=1 Tax=Niameybacter sp. TaxID=2033640 RepID=UPI002FCB8507